MIGKLFDWWHSRGRPEPISDALWRDTLATLPFLAALNADEQSRLREMSAKFLAEKEFTAAGGLELSDAMCVSIAAQGCLPILNLDLDCYRGWIGVIVYADEFIIPRSVEDEFGIVHEYRELASGEAWEGGPLLISWSDAQMAGEGYNVVIHEFAHKLDMLAGEPNGMPPLPEDIRRADWQRVLLAAFDDFRHRVEQADAGGEGTIFDPYAAASPGEFFAVMSEAFFETPADLLAEYPDFYANLARFYRQDPAARIPTRLLGDER